jgi:FKBP-type peptidyl-prolyl cis-trans isomerase (trigger factor)
MPYFVYCITIFYMQKIADRFPSGNKVATSYNRENGFTMPDLTFDSKGQLRQRLEIVYYERWKEKQKCEEQFDEIIRLREALKEANKQVILFQQKYQAELDKRDSDTYLKVSHNQITGS